jgi:sugar lactone lactonase YvrE
MRALLISILVLALAGAASTAGAVPGSRLQQRIALPNGFQPEGIASTGGKRLFVGSIATGAIWRGNAKTGNGAVLVPPHEGRSAIGIKVRLGLIFVAGGATGDAYLYDKRTGADVARYDLAPEGATTFVNDVVVTRRAAYFTDSRLQQLYVLPLGRRGSAPAQADVRTLPLSGDIAYTTGNNANGIVAAGRWLIIVQTNTGKLFRVNRATGATDEIELAGGANVVNGDGLLRRGNRLFVVQNRLNRIAVVRLAQGRRSGRVIRYLTDPDFDVPPTITFAAGRLFAVNARFGTPPGPDVPYWITRVG